ncbi:DUF6303 family protein [Streptomyces sp. NPDC096136]|uniref:DUF6303 family protein n=1 Tax=Streptomyces sp. NPDC096136 TaxID=3366076 RepID=UPI00382091AF
MSEVLTATLCQFAPGGEWSLWIRQGDVDVSAKLAPTASGGLPPLAARTEALAALGYRPISPSARAGGWTWWETTAEPQIYGEIIVEPAEVGE